MKAKVDRVWVEEHLENSGNYLETSFVRTTSKKYKSELVTGGILFGPHVYELECTKDYMLIYVPSHKAWQGMGCAWSDEKAMYYICKYWRKNDRGFHWMKCLKEIEPGPYFLVTRRELSLIMWMMQEKLDG